ncbi:hypothetical protein ACC743_39645, partial [Rhizobium ruizarguesonis]
GQAFVIITGGIELSVGSLVALLGVLFVDFIAVQDMSWMLALPLILVLGAVIGAVHGWLITSSMSLEIIRTATPASASA